MINQTWKDHEADITKIYHQHNERMKDRENDKLPRIAMGLMFAIGFVLGFGFDQLLRWMIL